ncbi:hypothetical protein CDAR_54311 [Caerostris darwini]|uniref:Uncharacterized protein n=1 Tax=Caerostris darwini TaxID=1538125 RepID=A0AAV4PRR2_9ARAC|nr:hypothetical protein CDAR_54311 [Caerostris darwini]
MIGDSLPLGINRSVVICEGREIYGRLGEEKKERKFYGGGNDKKCLASTFVRCCYCVPSSLVGHSHQLRRQISVWPVFGGSFIIVKIRTYRLMESQKRSS